MHRRLAYDQLLISIWTQQAFRTRTSGQNPCDRVVRRQVFEIYLLKRFPAALGVDLALPAIGELREQRNRATVFREIGERASFRDRANP